MSFLDEAGLRTLWGRTTSKIATIRSEVVSYTGTGNYGAGNTNKVTFTKAPQVLIMLGESRGSGWSNWNCREDWNFMIPMSVTAITFEADVGFGLQNGGDLFGRKSADGKTFEWYSENSASQQCNESDVTYSVLALFTETFALGNGGGNTGGGTTGGDSGNDTGGENTGDNTGGTSGGTTTNTVTATIEDYGNITVEAGTTWMEYIATSGASSGFYIDNHNGDVRLDDWYVIDPNGDTAWSGGEIVQGIYYLSYEREGGE